MPEIITSPGSNGAATAGPEVIPATPSPAPDTGAAPASAQPSLEPSLELPPELPEGASPEGGSPPEPFLESLSTAPDGTKTIYRSREEAAAGLAHKDFYIAELKAQKAAYEAQVNELHQIMRQGASAQQQPAQQRPNPQEAEYQEAVQYYVEELGFDEQSAKKLAARDIAVQQRAEQRALQASQSVIKQQWANDYKQIVATDPSFNLDNPQNELAITVVNANPNAPPSVNYQTYKRLAMTLGGQATSQPQAPSAQVQQATQQYAAQRESQQDNLRGSQGTGHLAAYKNLPPSVLQAAQLGIQTQPQRANDPKWVRENVELALNSFKRYFGVQSNGGNNR